MPPKRTDDQRQWIVQPASDDRRVVEDILNRNGAAYFLKNFKGWVSQLEYVRTL